MLRARSTLTFYSTPRRFTTHPLRSPSDRSSLGQRQVTTSTTSSRDHHVAPLIRPDAETLYACTTGRWLCNDELQRKMRYTPFNADASEQAVCRSVSAQRCVS
ncbi:hypothetical protein C8Q79DRAFT_989595 [Trametes meyenii]|nr:hypothetical protein C8Q79DRAFT_989595 [Trametes meyenii]